MGNIILKIDNLTKRYKDKVVLDHVSFEIEKGKIYGFIGENGAGKTTAIRSITGLTSIDEGSVELKQKIEQLRAKLDVSPCRFSGSSKNQSVDRIGSTLYFFAPLSSIN